MSGVQISTGVDSGLRPYHIGSSIDLMFQAEDALAAALGNSIDVGIYDLFDNQVDQVKATRVSQTDNLYLATYTFPLDLSARYNVLNDNLGERDPKLFYLKDKWIFPSGDFMEFPLFVYRAYEQPVADNMEYFIEISPTLISTDGSFFTGSPIHFTSSLVPYYCTVQEVIDMYKEIFTRYDKFAIAREIVNVSRIVDLHMRPDNRYVYAPERMQHAIKNFTKNRVAWNILNAILNTIGEEKTLDTFSIKKTSQGDRYLKDIEAQAQRFALIIWAGGKDTPFISKNFEKGVFDPNRPNISRAELDVQGWYPWVNTTTRTTIMDIDGNTAEVRGVRTTSFNHVRTAFTGYGGGLEGGDVGLLAGI